MSGLLVPSRWSAAALLMAGWLLGLAPPAAAEAVGSTHPGQASPPPSVTVTDLPDDVVYVDINNQGQVVGHQARTGAYGHTVIWSDGDLTDLGPYGPNSCPVPTTLPCGGPLPVRMAINDRGQVGTTVDSHAVLWQDGRTVDIDGEAESSWLLGLNERGQALVLGFGDGQQVLSLWSRGRLHQVATAPLPQSLSGLFTAQMSDGGHVVVTRLTGSVTDECPVTSHLWRRGERTELGSLRVRDINREGQLIGLLCEVGGSPDTVPVLWDAGEITPAPSVGDFPAQLHAINDRGQVTLVGIPEGTTGPHVYVWDGGGGLRDVSAGTGSGSNVPVAIDRRGRVLLMAVDASGNYRNLWLWERGWLVALPPQVPPPDDPGAVDVTGQLLNDRGQVVGARQSFPAGPPETSGPALWEVSRG